MRPPKPPRKPPKPWPPPLEKYWPDWWCPKCHCKKHTLHYDSMSDRLRVWCNKCGYNEYRLPIDYYPEEK